MKNIRITDEQIVEAWRRSRNCAEVGREFGLSRQHVSYRIMRMRANGMELPPARAQGFFLYRASDMARKIGRLGGRNARSKENRGDSLPTTNERD